MIVIGLWIARFDMCTKMPNHCHAPTGTHDSVTTLSDKDALLSAMSRCFAPIYTPVRCQRGIPALHGCVISISGYVPITQLPILRKKTSKRTTRGGLSTSCGSENSMEGKKIGRSELEHAITVAGGCFCGPLLV